MEDVRASCGLETIAAIKGEHVKQGPLSLTAPLKSEVELRVVAYKRLLNKPVDPGNNRPN
jgi:hypothetical protein